MKFVLTAVALCLLIKTHGQTKVFFLDKNQKIIKDSTKAFSRIQLEKKADSGWYATEYSREGILLSQGFYKDDKLKTPDGKFNYYWINYRDNGPQHYYSYLKTIGYYENGRKSGTWRSYAEDGSTTEIITFSEDKRDGPYRSFGKNKILLTDGSYLKDKREGEWHVYSQAGKLIITDTYSDGHVINTVRFGVDTAAASIKTTNVTGVTVLNGDKNGIRTIVLKSDDPNSITSHAAPIGDFKGIASKKIKKIVEGIPEGRLLLRFMILKDGTVQSPGIMRGLGNNEVDHEIADAVQNACKWSAATSNGQPVADSFYCAIAIDSSGVSVSYSQNINDFLQN